MEVKIKKKGKTKKYRVIESWKEVTLEKWIKLTELEGLTQAQETKALINTLSDIPEKLISKLSLPDITVILSRIAQIQQEKNNELVKVIEVDGKEYGFHPSLSDITLGEYADLEHFIKQGVQDNLPEIMAILYRPIVEKEGDAYIIEAYDGKIDVRAEKFKKMSAEQVESSLVFFWIFVNEWSKITKLYLLDQKEEMTSKMLEKVSLKSGDFLV
tara:strand:+ start:4765 stop:5406 length:642 start_codon:yes stop_codon:yes gene_type:complete